MRNTISVALWCGALVLVAWPTSAQAASPLSWLGLGSDGAASSVRITPVASSSKSPSILSKMNAGTKKMVTSTKNTFTPKSKKKTVAKTGTMTVRKAKNAEQEKPGFFKSLFQPEEPEMPRTVNEWMSLKRVQP